MKTEAVKTGTTKRHSRPYIEVEQHGKGVSVWVSMIYTESADPNEIVNVVEGAGIMALDALNG